MRFNDYRALCFILLSPEPGSRDNRQTSIMKIRNKFYDPQNKHRKSYSIEYFYNFKINCDGLLQASTIYLHILENFIDQRTIANMVFYL